jgi:uncharacterized protein
MKTALRVALIVAFIYVVAIMLSLALQTKLIFFPGKLPGEYKYDVEKGGEEVFFKTSDGETINGLFYKGAGTNVIIYFHGNAGDLSSWQQVAEDFTSFGFNLLIIDYRGYGKSTGELSEDGFYSDAEAAFQFAVTQKGFHENQIIAYGRSIGSGVAVDLASKHSLKGLILEAPYASLSQLVQERVPYLFPKFWLRYQFDSKQKLKQVKCPMLLIHGDSDAVIPANHSQILYNTFQGKKHFILIPGGPHNNLNVYPQYFEGIALASTGFF